VLPPKVSVFHVEVGIPNKKGGPLRSRRLELMLSLPVDFDFYTWSAMYPRQPCSEASCAFYLLSFLLMENAFAATKLKAVATWRISHRFLPFGRKCECVMCRHNFTSARILIACVPSGIASGVTCLLEPFAHALPPLGLLQCLTLLIVSGFVGPLKALLGGAPALVDRMERSQGRFAMKAVADTLESPVRT
jgi:hypothetical protein